MIRTKYQLPRCEKNEQGMKEISAKNPRKINENIIDNHRENCAFQ